MKNLKSKYLNLVNETKNTLIDVINNCGVTTVNIPDKKVIALQLHSIVYDSDFNNLCEYDYLTNDLKLINHLGYESILEYDDILELFTLIEEIPLLHNKNEIIRIIVNDVQIDNKEIKESFYNSIDDALDSINENNYSDVNSILIQKWCEHNNKWIDYTPKLIKIYNHIDDVVIGMFNLDDAIKRIKLIINEDLKDDDKIDNLDAILESNNINTLLHNLYKYNENILIEYIY